jgi:hypothetical protein
MNKWITWTALGVAGAMVLLPLIKKHNPKLGNKLQEFSNDASDAAEGLIDQIQGTV